jgi:hypothetical protein
MTRCAREAIMVQRGTVVNGLIAGDGDECANVPPPPVRETREEFLESLRQSIDATRAGERGIPVNEAMARIAAELNLPSVSPK